MKEMTRSQTAASIRESYGLGWATGGPNYGHGGAFATNMTIDSQPALITIYLVQHAGFPRGREQGQGRIRKKPLQSDLVFRRIEEVTSYMSIENYQNLVIGSGVGGKLVAWTLARRGQKTVVVERAMIGGSCPNVACLPSKNVIYSAKAVSLVDPKTGLGVMTGACDVDMAGVARRKRQMVDELVALHLANFKASGAELVMGEARFTEAKTVKVTLNAGGSRQLRGDRVFLPSAPERAFPTCPDSPPPGR